jgi:hypothetical protein
MVSSIRLSCLLTSALLLGGCLGGGADDPASGSEDRGLAAKSVDERFRGEWLAGAGAHPAGPVVPISAGHGQGGASFRVPANATLVRVNLSWESQAPGEVYLEVGPEEGERKWKRAEGGNRVSLEFRGELPEGDWVAAARPTGAVASLRWTIDVHVEWTETG